MIIIINNFDISNEGFLSKMAVSKTNEQRAERTIANVTDSPLPTAEKEECVDLINSSKEATNGYSLEEKLQATSENQFHMIRMLVESKIDSAYARAKINEDIGRLEDMMTDYGKRLEKNDAATDKLSAQVDILNKNIELIGQLGKSIGTTKEDTGKSSRTWSKIAESIKEVLIAWKWTIVLIIWGLCTLFALRPELSSLITAFANKQ